MAKKISIRSLELLWPQEGQNAREAPAIPALLRLARAAKSVTDNLEPHSPMFANHDCAVCDLRAALDAFDFS